MKRGQRPRRHIRYVRTPYGTKSIIVNPEIVKPIKARFLKEELNPEFKVPRLKRFYHSALKQRFKSQLRTKRTSRGVPNIPKHRRPQ